VGIYEIPAKCVLSRNAPVAVPPCCTVCHSVDSPLMTSEPAAATQTWETISLRLRESLNASTFANWFGAATPIEQDAERLWSAIAAAALGSPVVRVRAGPWGLGCDIRPVLELNQRTAAILVAWHYSEPDAAPRLVTAYPTP